MAKRYSNDELASIEKEFESLLFSQEMHYLLVDRQIASRRAVMNVLVGAGVDRADITEVSDGLDATMHINKSESPLVILTEFKLPDMDVIGLLKNIRSREENSRHKVILITGERNKQRLSAAVKLGINGLVRKPFQPEELAEQLRQCGAL
jgi:CheY-like chemotaxis protein